MCHKILSLILALCLVASLLTVFSACGEEEDVSLSRKTVSLDLSEYSIIYPDSVNGKAVTTTFQKTVTAFAENISAAIGKNVRSFSESKYRGNDKNLEILVGHTSRAESQTALSAIEGDGYTIQVINNKVVLVGTTNLLTLAAVEYFENNFLKANGGGTLTLHEEATCANMETVIVADSEKGYYSFIYGADYDKSLPTDSSYDTTPSGTTTLTRYAYTMIQESVDHIAKQISLKNSRTLSVKTDQSLASSEQKNVIAVGMTNYPITQKLLGQLAVDEYGIYIENGTIAVGAWNAQTLIACKVAFLDYLSESVVTEGDTSHVMLPAKLSLSSKTKNNWQTDFPKPEGLQLYNTAEMTQDSLEYLYMDTVITAETYNEYCDLLESEGYNKISENEIEDSCFAFFVNSEKQISLYVAYNAYKHATGSDYAYAIPSLRIVSSTIDNAMLPPTQMLSQQSYEKKTDSAITATGLPSASSGEGYIITLEDGRFVVIDSGNTKKGTEVDNYKKALWDLQERNSGQPVSKSNPVRIAAWILTHSHDDHYKVFVELLTRVGKSGELFVEYMIGNYPTETQLVNIGGDFSATKNLPSYQALLTEPFTFIKAHTGQKLYIGNMEIETLFTHEDLNPHNIVTFNDSSTIMRLTINVTDGEPVTLLSTGDAYRYAGRWCCAMYGTTLRSDMVTMAHHGGPAVEKLFYTYVAPTVIWWPHNTATIHSGYLKQNNEHSLVDQHAYNLPSVKYVYCSGDDHNITLYLRADGPAYDDLYNAGFGNSLTYDQYHAVKK